MNAREKLVTPNINHLSEILRPIAYDDDDCLFAMEDNYLGFGFVTDPMPGADPKAHDRINNLLSQNFPNGTVIQIALWAMGDIKHHLVRMRAPRISGPGEEVSEVRRRATWVIEQMHDFYDRHASTPYANGTGIRVRDVNLVISVHIPTNSDLPTEKEIVDASSRRRAVQQALRASGMGGWAMTKEVYVRLMRTVLNWQQGAEHKQSNLTDVDDEKPINTQCVDPDTEIEIRKKEIVFGTDIDEGKIDKVAKVFSVKKFPQSVQFGMASRYITEPISGARGIHDNLIIAATIIYDDPQKLKDRIAMDRSWTDHQASGALAKFNYKLRDKHWSHQEMAEALEDGDRPIRMYLGFVLFSDPDDVDQACSNFQTYMSELKLNVLPDSHVVFPLFMQCMPFGAEPKLARELVRYKTMATRHAVGLIPIFGDWKGTGTATVSFTGRTGQIVAFDLFDSESNYNGVIAGQSGAGKSFTANWIICSYLSIGGRAWIIDIGRSYSKLVESVGGQFIVFDDQSDMQMNPFEKVVDFDEEAEMLVSLIETMASPDEAMDAFQRSAITRHLTEAWHEKKHSLVIDDVVTRCLEDEDKRVRDIGQQLYSYSRKGVYGKMFNRGNNVDFSSDLVVLELEELNNKKALQKVILLQLIFQIQHEMYLGERDRRKILMVDESWALMNEGAVGAFMETAWRRLRKYGAAGLLGTQSLNDLYQSKHGIAIAENSANKILLSQTRETLKSLKKEERLEIGDFGHLVLEKVHTARGRYSEIFFHTNRGMGAVQLVVPKQVELLFSTLATEVQAIKEITKEYGCDVTEAISIYMKNNGHVDAKQREHPIVDTLSRSVGYLTRSAYIPKPVLNQLSNLFQGANSEVQKRIRELS
jgi:conjugal transfer ATP-binding protein TraC